MNPQVRSDGDSPKKRNSGFYQHRWLLCGAPLAPSIPDLVKRRSLHFIQRFPSTPHHTVHDICMRLSTHIKPLIFLWKHALKLFTTNLDNPYPTCLQIYSNQLWITLGFLFAHVTCTPKSLGPINQGQISSQLHYSLPLSMIPLLPPTNYSLLPTH